MKPSCHFPGHSQNVNTQRSGNFMGVSQARWMVYLMENPQPKMDDWGYPHDELETPKKLKQLLCCSWQVLPLHRLSEVPLQRSQIVCDPRVMAPADFQTIPLVNFDG